MKGNLQYSCNQHIIKTLNIFKSKHTHETTCSDAVTVRRLNAKKFVCLIIYQAVSVILLNAYSLMVMLNIGSGLVILYIRPIRVHIFSSFLIQDVDTHTFLSTTKNRTLQRLCDQHSVRTHLASQFRQQLYSNNPANSRLITSFEQSNL
jgi:hypothetical protein